MKESQLEDLLYVDTSAYLCLLLGEKGSSKVEKAVFNRILCSSAFLIIEVERNLVRLSREKILSESDFARCQDRLTKDVESFVLKDVDMEICRSGAFPAVKTPRSSDLVHLRTALWFMKNENLGGFLTLDQHQLEAAKELKIPI